MNTYAELCGNTKKGPIKNGPGNKLITGDIGIDQIDSVFKSAFGIVNNEKVGGTMSKLSELVSPATSAISQPAVVSFGDSIVSKETNRLKGLGVLSSGI